ncbi:MAG TPA: proton-conducting transporter membrane subunit, partial [Thiohalobacter sp.]|nr:proton-conducting transporter membrane subunit [Thiohalobacter sp.]
LLASYGLLLHGGGPDRTRAGLHFVVINLAGSTLFLFAVGTLYGVLGTLNMADLARRMAQVGPAELGLIQAAGLLLFGVFALKAALVPLYLWLPAAYAGTSAPVAALFAVMTKVGVYSILRLDTLIFGSLAGDSAHLLGDWLLPLALVTLALGMAGVVASTGLRQQAAYLVVASVGTLLTAAGLGTAGGLAAGLYYLPHTTFAAGALFLLADGIARRRGELADRLAPNGSLSHPRLLGALFFITAVLIAGLPPLSGFVAKFLILRAALPHPALVWIMAVVLMTSLLAIIALARSGSVLFYRARVVIAPAGGRLLPELAPATALLLLCLGLVLWAGPVHEYTLRTAQQLYQPQLYIDAVLSRGITP